MTLVRLQRSLLALLLVAVVGLISACGIGGGSGYNAPAGGVGGVAVILNFGQAAANLGTTPLVGAPVLFSTTKSVQVQLLDPNDKSHVLATATAERANNEGSLVVRLSNVPAGSYLVYVLCYDGPGQSGNVSGVALPPVVVTTGEAEVEVSAASSKTITELAVTPTSVTMTVGDTRQLTAIATFNDNSDEDVTTLATWSANTTTTLVGTSNIVSVGSHTGLVTALNGGSEQVKASFGGFEATASVDVKNLALLFNSSDAAAPFVQAALTLSKVYTLASYASIANPTAVDAIATDTSKVQITGLAHGTLANGSNAVDVTPSELTAGTYGTFSNSGGACTYTAPSSYPTDYIFIKTSVLGQPGTTLTFADQ